MSKKSLVLFLATFVVITLIVSACGITGSQKEFKLAYDGVTGKWPYMAKFNKYVHDFATEADITLVYAESGGDISTQLTTVENFFVQDVDMVSALFMDREGALPVIDMAKNADNVPVISVLTSIKDEGNGYENYIYVGSKNYDGGFLQGVWLAEHLPQGAGIWLLNSQPGDQQGYDRVDGLKAGLLEKGRTDVTFVADMYAENMKDKGVTIMEDWLNTYDKIDCVVGTNDDSVLGAIEATKAADRMDEGIIFVGLDGSDPALDSIQAGEMSMSVLQDAFTQAKELINVAVKIRNGEDPSKIADVFVPFQAITIENVKEFIGR